jgi:hypothetical protein
MTVPLYMDHHVKAAITDGLRRRGVDVLTCAEDGTAQADDDPILTRATALGRTLFHAGRRLPGVGRRVAAKRTRFRWSRVCGAVGNYHRAGHSRSGIDRQGAGPDGYAQPSRILAVLVDRITRGRNGSAPTATASGARPASSPPSPKTGRLTAGARPSSAVTGRAANGNRKSFLRDRRRVANI